MSHNENTEDCRISIKINISEKNTRVIKSNYRVLWCNLTLLHRNSAIGMMMGFENKKDLISPTVR